MADKTLCSTLSAEASEPLWGSAPTVSRLLLATWPKRQWTSRALQSPHVPPIFGEWAARHSTELEPAKARLLWRHSEPVDAGVRLWLFPEGVCTGPVPTDELESLLGPDFRADDPRWMPIDRPLLTICTHGKHDACCALHGMGVFRAVSTAVDASGLSLDVWESSHLGGHRFASTALSLPSGRMWGHLRAADAAELVGHLARDTVWADRYRGNSWLSAPIQIAEAYGWHELGGAAGTVTPGAASIDGERTIVDVAVSGPNTESMRFRVTVAPGFVATPKGCDDIGSDGTFADVIKRPVLESAQRAD